MICTRCDYKISLPLPISLVSDNAECTGKQGICSALGIYLQPLEIKVGVAEC